MDRGTAGHRALAEWYRSHNQENAIRSAWEFWSGMGYVYEDEEWGLLEAALLRYFVWSLESDEFSFLKEEYEFKIDLAIRTIPSYEDVPAEGYPVVFNGFVDGIVEEKGRTWLLENKFYKRMDNSDKTMDIQSSLYMLATQILGMDVAGVIYNMIRIGDTKIAIKEPVVRRRVHRNPQGLDAILHELVIQAEAMVKFEREGGRAYRNPTKDCSWDCPFYAPCLSMMDDGIEPTDMLKKISVIRRNENE